MTVSEFIALLANYPPTARVVVDGRKGGLEDVIELAAANIRVDTSPDVDDDGHELMDAEAPTEAAVWIKGVNSRGERFSTQNRARQDHGVFW